jgi:hypothetical protein
MIASTPDPERAPCVSSARWDLKRFRCMLSRIRLSKTSLSWSSVIAVIVTAAVVFYFADGDNTLTLRSTWTVKSTILVVLFGSTWLIGPPLWFLLEWALVLGLLLGFKAG